MEGKGKGVRGTWSKAEEEALLTVLDELVAAGAQGDCGVFVAGTGPKIERRMEELLPGSGLKYSPHIESKMKDWKRKYAVFFDMLNTSGFGWNNEKKCIEVDSDEAWDNYVQNHKGAKGWRGRPFPMYDRFAKIWGKDRATGGGARTPVDMETEVDQQEFAGNQEGFMESSPMSINQTQKTAGGSYLSGSKRKRDKQEAEVNLAGFLHKFEDMVDSSNQSMKEIAQKLKEDPNTANQMVYDEIHRLGFSVHDRMRVLPIMLQQPDKMAMFRLIRDDEEKIIFLLQLLRG